MPIQEIDQFELAERYINQTKKNVFLTGKAGTGKTTFLRKITKNSFKNTVVAAPTGIAAINAGGVTLHSLFHLPFGTFIPDEERPKGVSFEVNTPSLLKEHFQYNSAKRSLLRELELLIIDEVSMLRADILDAINLALQYVRKSQKPFGGVQMLFIGDLLQLPPVVKREEGYLLGKYYHSNFFFDAHSLQSNKPVYIELKKVFRQTEQEFINILNNIRTNEFTPIDIDTLNLFYKPGYKPEANDEIIHLTTHNRKADTINDERLEELESKPKAYKAIVNGDFPRHNYPMDDQLILKEGAQVMFIKNDPSGRQQFFNGKIGTVKSLKSNGIEVGFNDSVKTIEVEKYAWENKTFELNDETNQIEENVKGSFEQYPLKLAWAITIHKSQGLTFDKAIIDISEVFASGQAYVALSRLRTLEGLVLTEPIPNNLVGSDKKVLAFSRTEKSSSELTNELNHFEKDYVFEMCYDTFHFSPLIAELEENFNKHYISGIGSPIHKYSSWAEDLYEDGKKLFSVAENFQREIASIQRKKEKVEVLEKRIKAAEKYFDVEINKLTSSVLKHIAEVKKEKKVKGYLKDLDTLETSIYKSIQNIKKASKIVNAIVDEKSITKEDIYSKDEMLVQRTEMKSNITKNDTKKVTFDMFKLGMSIDEIAKERNLNIGTIETHFIHFIEQGDISTDVLIKKEKLDKGIALVQAMENKKLISVIKKTLPDEYTYTDIKVILALLNKTVA